VQSWLLSRLKFSMLGVYDMCVPWWLLLLRAEDLCASMRTYYQPWRHVWHYRNTAYRRRHGRAVTGHWTGVRDHAIKLCVTGYTHLLRITSYSHPLLLYCLTQVSIKHGTLGVAGASRGRQVPRPLSDWVIGIVEILSGSGGGSVGPNVAFGPTKIVATRHVSWAKIYQKCFWGRGSAADSAAVVYNVPPDPP